MRVERSSSVTAASKDQRLDVDDARSWLATIPSDAVLSPRLTDIGSQRDPWAILNGLSATWTEVE
jgi:hypothetical protein